MRRDVAQPGRAPRSGRGGRRFNSSHPDHIENKRNNSFLQISLLKKIISFMFRKNKIYWQSTIHGNTPQIFATTIKKQQFMLSIFKSTPVVDPKKTKKACFYT